MAKVRCFLCGGRVSRGVCTECGMPQRQHAQNYSLNESDCDDQPLTHVHYDYEHSSKNTYANREQRREKRASYAKKERRKERSKSGSKLFIIVAVIIVLIIVINIIATVASNLIGIRGIINNFSGFESEEAIPDWFVETFDSSYMELDEDNYDWVMYELEETGEFASKGLYAGYYVIGYDLPEGTYSLTVLSGEGDISVDDWENGIYLYESLDVDGEYGYTTIDNMRLYNGAQIQVYGSVQLRLEADNAGAILPSEENPLLGNPDVVIPGGEMYLAGTDFPAGTYDLSLEGSYDYVDLFVLTDETAILEDGETYDYDYESYIDCFFMVDPTYEESDWDLTGYAENVANVTIEEGTYVRISDSGNVLYMTPSPFVVPEEGVENGKYY